VCIVWLIKRFTDESENLNWVKIHSSSLSRTLERISSGKLDARVEDLLYSAFRLFVYYEQRLFGIRHSSVMVFSLSKKRLFKSFCLFWIFNFLCLWINSDFYFGLSCSLQDRHIKKHSDGEPIVDPSQDYILLLGYENATHTVLRFKRKLETCDTSHDIQITVSVNVN
jgi:DOMON domain